MRVYIGHDRREQKAFAVAEKTARAFGCDTHPIYEDVLRAQGLLTRPLDRRGGMWDFASDAPQSTQFAVTRFYAPVLAHSGWCLAVDCDIAVLRDPHQLLELADVTKAVMVVKHKPYGAHTPKMDGQKQTVYPRKGWSSVVLWNCNHPANRRLNLTTLNQWPGRDLHAFAWLHDDEIGELPSKWNHLVGIDPPRDDAAILHFTMGTPDMPGYERCEYADVWTEASQR